MYGTCLLYTPFTTSPFEGQWVLSSKFGPINFKYKEKNVPQRPLYYLERSKLKVKYAKIAKTPISFLAVTAPQMV